MDGRESLSSAGGENQRRADDWFATGERVRVVLPSGAFDVFSHVTGSGPWLTFLHGFPTSSWDWAQVVPALEHRFRTLCFDFLGFGDSDKPRRHRYSIAEQADLTEQLWRHFGVEKTGLVAHDYGATVAQELLAREREGNNLPTLSGVVLLNAALYSRLARPLVVQRLLANPLLGPFVARLVTERIFARSFASIFSEAHPLAKDDLREHWRVLQRRGGSSRISHRLARYLVERRRHAERWEGALQRTRIPIGFVWGMADPRSGAPIVARLRQRVPVTPLVELFGIGHYPQLEVPDRVAEEIESAFACA